MSMNKELYDVLTVMHHAGKALRDGDTKSAVLYLEDAYVALSEHVWPDYEGDRIPRPDFEPEEPWREGR